MCEQQRPDNSLVYHGNPANGQLTGTGDTAPGVQLLGQPPRRFVLCSPVAGEEADDRAVDAVDDAEDEPEDDVEGGADTGGAVAGNADDDDLDDDVEDSTYSEDEDGGGGAPIGAPIGVLAVVLTEDAEAGGASGLYEPVMWGLEDQDGAFVHAYDPVTGYRQQGFFGSAERARALFGRLRPLRLVYV